MRHRAVLSFLLSVLLIGTFTLSGCQSSAPEISHMESQGSSLSSSAQQKESSQGSSHEGSQENSGVSSSSGETSQENTSSQASESTLGSSAPPASLANASSAATSHSSSSSSQSSHQHIYSAKVIAPTCTSGGYTQYTCSCGSSYTGNSTQALGHTMGQFVIKKQPTTTSEGSKQRTCSRCGYTETVSIPKLEEPSGDLNAFVNEVIRLVNQERSKNNLAPLTAKADLNTYASTRSRELLQIFNHLRPDGTDPLTPILGMGYFTAGENIAKGFSSPEAVMEGWMNSPGHKANILSPYFSYIGVGCFMEDGDLYWTQVFAG